VIVWNDGSKSLPRQEQRRCTVVAFGIGLAGPGVYSLDEVLKLALPAPMTYVVALVAVIGTLML
jgi:hypothetical protein